MRNASSPGRPRPHHSLSSFPSRDTLTSLSQHLSRATPSQVFLGSFLLPFRHGVSLPPLAPRDANTTPSVLVRPTTVVFPPQRQETDCERLDDDQSPSSAVRREERKKNIPICRQANGQIARFAGMRAGRSPAVPLSSVQGLNSCTVSARSNALSLTLSVSCQPACPRTHADPSLPQVTIPSSLLLDRPRLPLSQASTNDAHHVQKVAAAYRAAHGYARPTSISLPDLRFRCHVLPHLELQEV